MEEYRRALPKRRRDARPVDTMKNHRDVGLLIVVPCDSEQLLINNNKDKLEFLRKELDVQKRQLNLVRLQSMMVCQRIKF